MSYLKILVCSAFMLCGLFSYGQDPQKGDTVSLLSQNWKIQQLYQHNFKAEEKEELEEFIQTTQMQFNSDGSFLTRTDTVIIKGKWQLRGNMITIQMEEGESFRMKILALSPNGFQFASLPLGSEAISSAGMMVPVRNKFHTSTIVSNK